MTLIPRRVLLLVAATVLAATIVYADVALPSEIKAPVYVLNWHTGTSIQVSGRASGKNGIQVVIYDATVQKIVDHAEYYGADVPTQLHLSFPNLTIPTKDVDTLWIAAFEFPSGPHANPTPGNRIAIPATIPSGKPPTLDDAADAGTCVFTYSTDVSAQLEVVRVQNKDGK
jgi:hypothetical protein